MNSGSRGMLLRKKRGFTLVEMLITLVIIGVGLTIAVPGFQGMMARNRIAVQVNELLLAINLARSEAGRQGRRVSVLAVDDSDADNEFGLGWCVIPTADAEDGDDCGDPTAIRQFEALNGDSTMNFVNGVDPEQLVFSTMGAPRATIDIDLCYPNQQARRIHINRIGRTKSHRSGAATVEPNVAKLPCTCTDDINQTDLDGRCP